jgi:hypothetical protein
VIGDLAGYAAATYLRGVPFIQVLHHAGAGGFAGHGKTASTTRSART